MAQRGTLRIGYAGRMLGRASPGPPSDSCALVVVVRCHGVAKVAGHDVQGVGHPLYVLNAYHGGQVAEESSS
jgi:hypothetical protein